MAIKIAINGFGRIGRLTFRNLLQRSSEFEVVAINDLSKIDMNATLLKYDSVHGRFDGTVTHDEQNLVVNGKPVRVFQLRNPAELPWKDLKVDIVIETHFMSAVSLSSFTPSTQVKSAPSLAGALSTTFLAPAARCVS